MNMIVLLDLMLKMEWLVILQLTLHPILIVMVVNNGPALVDSCGDCQLAYVYNFITHVPTFINDTAGLILGPTEILVFPNDSTNPLMEFFM